MSTTSSSQSKAEPKTEPHNSEETKAPPKKEKEQKCYVLRVKRKKTEKPADSLILETIELPNKRKCLRVLPPEDFVEKQLNELALKSSHKTAANKEKPMVFQRITKELDEETKKAKEVKVAIDGKCELFEVNAKTDANAEQIKGKRIELMGIQVHHESSQKEEVMKEHEKLGKKKRSDLINKKRKDALEELQKGNIYHIKKRLIEETKEKIDILKENDDTSKADILYCNEKPLTIE